MSEDPVGLPSNREYPPLPQPADFPPPNLLARFVLWLVRLYQRFLSPLLGCHCRYYPSCSRYFTIAVLKYGLLRGGLKGTWRIVRCNPLWPGGVDFP